MVGVWGLVGMVVVRAHGCWNVRMCGGGVPVRDRELWLGADMDSWSMCICLLLSARMTEW